MILLIFGEALLFVVVLANMLLLEIVGKARRRSNRLGLPRDADRLVNVLLSDIRVGGARSLVMVWQSR
jgi:hypothetical protein